MDTSTLLGRLIVNFVLCLICFISYSSQIFIIWPWYGRELSIPLLKLLIPFNVLVAMLLWNYSLCVFTDPGRVPDSWRPDTHMEGFEVKKLTGGPRYCRMCERYKPPRAHHCRQCNRCVLRMDHHCPWVNNCVGHFNYGHFIRFLFFVDLACSYHVIMVTMRVYDTVNQRYWDEPSSTELIFIILNYVTCIPVLLAVGGFSLYHFYSLMGNSTTIEGWEKDKVATMIRRGKIREVKFPYNLGAMKNIKSILGDSPLWWCWPSVTPGTGLRYEVAERDDDATLQWPPQDPTKTYRDEDEKEEERPEFILPETPWTYENGTVNPELRPYNSQLRASASAMRSRRKRAPRKGGAGGGGGGTSSLPPYHPDYREDEVLRDDDDDEQNEEEEQDSDEYEYGPGNENASGYTTNPRVVAGKPLMRRGSEGYEVKPVNREEMLHRYLRELGETPGRYHRYIPQVESESSGGEAEVDVDVEM